MKNPPKGWPRISASVFYDDAAAAIDWLASAFGFEVRVKIEDDSGKIVHSQLTLPGDGLIMVGQVGLTGKRPWAGSPKSLEGKNTQALVVMVDDAEVHCARARAAGATIATEPDTQDYGDDYWVDRTYEAVDPEGHHWWFIQRLRTGGEAH